MAERPIRILLRGDARWVPILSEELAECGIIAAPVAGLLDSLRRLAVRPLVHRWRAQILHQLFVGSWTDGTYAWARRKGKKVIAHWIGTDVVELRRHIEQAKQLPEHVEKSVDLHLADSPQLQQELKSMGVESTVIRLLPRRLEANVLPLPPQMTVLSYWQDFRPQFYRADMIMELARRFADVKFRVVGATGKDVAAPPPNVEFLGNVSDMEAIYANATALIRILEHDSLSAMVLEAMARGRYVLYSEPFPHTLEARTLEQASACLERLRTQRQPNEAGARHVRENFNWRGEVQRLKDVYRSLLK